MPLSARAAGVYFWLALPRWAILRWCPTGIADVAQLVAHHLAKVRVAGSNPVVRSQGVRTRTHGGVAERRGNGLQSRVHGFKSRRHLVRSTAWAIGAGASALP